MLSEKTDTILSCQNFLAHFGPLCLGSKCRLNEIFDFFGCEVMGLNALNNVNASIYSFFFCFPLSGTLFHPTWTLQIFMGSAVRKRRLFGTGSQTLACYVLFRCQSPARTGCRYLLQPSRARFADLQGRQLNRASFLPILETMKIQV